MDGRLFPLHATGIAIDGHGVALCGRSGSGKSDLALRLIDRGAALIGDDYLDVADNGDALCLHHRPTIAGKIEVRGVDIITLPYVESAPLRLMVILDEPVERLPEAGFCHAIMDHVVPALRLDAFAISAAIKVELALRAIVDAGRFPVRRLNPARNGQPI